MAKMAPKRRREKEDPNNTWNMQFMAACKVGNTHEMEVLIEKGAEIDHFVKEGEGEEEIINTPLINRVRARDLPMIQWLASKGADVNKEMEQSMTPLHYAVAHDMPDVIETLMGLSPDTTKKNAAGHTAVHLAFFRRKGVPLRGFSKTSKLRHEGRGVAGNIGPPSPDCVP